MFRQMNRIKQQLPQEEAIALLKQQPRGVLSLQGDDGYPYGVPTNFWYSDADGCIYFHSGSTGHKVDALHSHDKASFCVYDRGYREEGDWALQIKSVIVFGRIQIVEDPEEAIDLTRRLSYKYTQDSDYIEEEIRLHSARLLCFKLVPEHMTGKIVKES